MYTKLYKLLERHLPKPPKMDYFGVGAKREVVVLEMRVLMQVKSAHLDICRKSYEFLNKKTILQQNSRIKIAATLRDFLY